MKTTILTVLLLALLAATPATPPPPAAAQTITPGGMGPTVNVTAPATSDSGPSVTFENDYQTLGECQALPRVTGVLGVCGQTLLVKAGGVP